jgi:hypothetical protein
VDATTVRTWLEALGLQAWTRTGSGGEEVTFGTQAGGEQPGLVRWRTPTLIDVCYTRRVGAAELATVWRDPSNASPPIAELGNAVRFAAARFPLVTGEAADDPAGPIVQFSAVVFDEQLTRQAFSLTASAVLKAADMFEVGSKARAEQLAALSTVQAR